MSQLLLVLAAIFIIYFHIFHNNKVRRVGRTKLERQRRLCSFDERRIVIPTHNSIRVLLELTEQKHPLQIGGPLMNLTFQFTSLQFTRF